jgi:hypothetical protein
MKIEMDLVRSRRTFEADSLVITAQGIVSGNQKIAEFGLVAGQLVLVSDYGQPVGDHSQPVAWIEATA